MGKLVPCVRECRNFISNMSGLVCKDIVAIAASVLTVQCKENKTTTELCNRDKIILSSESEWNSTKCCSLGQ